MTHYADLVGFWYAQAVRELHEVMTYDQIAEAIGYQSHNSVYKILEGSTPAHVNGEALWALYCDTFGRKPPMKSHQSAPLQTT